MSVGESARRWPVINDADPLAFARLYLALDDRLRGYEATESALARARHAMRTALAAHL